MRRTRPRPTIGIAATLAALLALAPLGPSTTATTPDVDEPEMPTLVEIRAAHHPGIDRVVFEFSGPLPEYLRAEWVDEVVQDGSGLPVEVAGGAFIAVTMYMVRAHEEEEPFEPTYGPPRRCLDLPNLVEIVNAGDFEAVVSFGLGLRERTSIIRTWQLEAPSRFVIDIAAAEPTEPVPGACPLPGVPEAPDDPDDPGDPDDPAAPEASPSG
jgi:hypothetical protein